jgi:hypothetical protein
MAVSMGLAMVAAGLIVASVAELRRTRAELEKTKIEDALHEAQVRAVLVLLQNSASGRLSWNVDTDLGQARILAEPEYAKASFGKAAAADDKVLEQLGVEDPDELKFRLSQTAPTLGDQAWLVGLDSAVLWRACAPSLISRYGQGEALTLARASVPTSQGFSWRPGEVWRLRATLNGWADDRIVRLTGDDQSPAEIIERHMLHTQGEDDRCEAAFSKHA